MNLSEYTQLKGQAERLRREADRAIGARETRWRQLQKKYGVQTVEDAKTLLAKYKQKAAESAAAYDKTLQQFRRDYGKKIEQIG